MKNMGKCKRLPFEFLCLRSSFDFVAFFFVRARFDANQPVITCSPEIRYGDIIRRYQFNYCPVHESSWLGP